MKQLEYQGKELLAKHGIHIPKGFFCRTAEETATAVRQLGGKAILKVQIPSGRRGKGGGVRQVQDESTGFAIAEELLAKSYYGYQPTGLLVEQILPISQELYFSILTDTSVPWFEPVILLSTAGGMEVEELLRDQQAVLRQEHVDPRYGPSSYQIRSLLSGLALTDEAKAQLSQIVVRAWQAYWQYDLELLEINPLVVTTDEEVVALDAKVSIDNNALFRQKEFPETVFPSRERQATEKGLSYVDLDGNIGVISNGAGLTMFTMDEIVRLGGRPANFLDTGERILRDGIRDSLEILRDNPQVERILINVFAGGPRCDVVANKIVEAVRQGCHGGKPIFVSLRGRLEEEGQKILRENPLPGVTVLPDFAEAVQRATAAV